MTTSSVTRSRRLRRLRRLRRHTTAIVPAALVALLVVVMLGACSPSSADADGSPEPAADRPRPQDATDAVLDAFDRYQVVGGFSAFHGSKGVDDFLLDLIRHPDFPAKVDDIVVECGNAFYQDVLDRYVAGEDVPLAEVRQVWRTRSQVECGFATFPEQLVLLARRINQGLPDDEKLRILAGEPPLDWSQVDSPDDLDQDRDAHIASIMESEVLSQDRRALMLYGINHVRHVEGTAVGRYEANGYDGVTYVIDDHQGFGNQDPALRADNDEMEARMADWPVPSIVPIEGWFEELDTAYYNDILPGEDEGTGNPGVDAYLYVGARDDLLRSLRSAQALTDHAYLAELREQADHMGEPPDSPRRPETILEMEANESIFLFDPQRQGPGPGTGSGSGGGEGAGPSEGEGSATGASGG